MTKADDIFRKLALSKHYIDPVLDACTSDMGLAIKLLHSMKEVLDILVNHDEDIEAQTFDYILDVWLEKIYEDPQSFCTLEQYQALIYLNGYIKFSEDSVDEMADNFS